MPIQKNKAQDIPVLYLELVEGFEPSTCRLRGGRSGQLSYTSIKMERMTRFELATLSLGS